MEQAGADLAGDPISAHIHGDGDPALALAERAILEGDAKSELDQATSELDRVRLLEELVEAIREAARVGGRPQYLRSPASRS